MPRHTKCGNRGGQGVIDCKPRMDRVYLVPVIKNSSHRDGAIYKNKFIREDFWEGDIADRNESKWSKMTKSLQICMHIVE